MNSVLQPNADTIIVGDENTYTTLYRKLGWRADAGGWVEKAYQLSQQPCVAEVGSGIGGLLWHFANAGIRSVGLERLESMVEASEYLAKGRWVTKNIDIFEFTGCLSNDLIVAGSSFINLLEGRRQRQDFWRKMKNFSKRSGTLGLEISAPGWLRSRRAIEATGTSLSEDGSPFQYGIKIEFGQLEDGRQELVILYDFGNERFQHTTKHAILDVGVLQQEAINSGWFLKSEVRSIYDVSLAVEFELK